MRLAISKHYPRGSFSYHRTETQIVCICSAHLGWKSNSYTKTQNKYVIFCFSCCHSTLQCLKSCLPMQKKELLKSCLQSSLRMRRPQTSEHCLICYILTLARMLMVCILLPSTNKKIVLRGVVSQLGTRLVLEYYNFNWSSLHLHTEKITQYILYFLEHGMSHIAFSLFNQLTNHA